MNVLPFPKRRTDSGGLAEWLLAQYPLRPSRRRQVRLTTGDVAELVAQSRDMGVVRLTDGTLSVVGKVLGGAR